MLAISISKINSPWELDTVPMDLPSIKILANDNGSFVSKSKTLPLKKLFWANKKKGKHDFVSQKIFLKISTKILNFFVANQ